MMLAAFASLSPNGNDNKTLTSKDISFNYEVLTKFFIINNLSSPTPSYFDEHIIVNSSLYPNENPNLSNVFFMTDGTTLIPSWLQSGNSNQAFNTSYWLRINESIPAHDYMEICMNAATLGTNILNNYSIGEAPQLTNVYGLYDDGSHIFNFYDNFAGTTLDKAKWNALNANYTVDNGISFTESDSYITSRLQFSYPSCVEAYGIMNTPQTNDSKSYSLGGVGFGKGGMDYTSPVFTSGWTENLTNGFGLTFYNGESLYYYNYSKSANINDYHIFGTGFINDSYVRGTLDNIFQNSSRNSLLVPSSQELNLTLGFQALDFPKVNDFKYIMEFNSTPDGAGIPYSFSLHKVTFKENGLQSGGYWGIDIPNLINTLENNGITSLSCFNYSLVPGVYNYTVYSDDPGYQAFQNKGNFTVKNSNVFINVSFVIAKTATTFEETGLPKGTDWKLNLFTNSSNFTAYTSNMSSIVVNIQNGSFIVTFNDTSNGYVPFPDYKIINVNGFPETYIIEFESPKNLSLLKPLKSFNPSMEEQNNGYNNILTGNGVLTDLAVDSSSNMIFSILQNNGIIVPYNITTGMYLKNITLGSNSYPACEYYDNQNGYLYVSNRGTGNLTIINGRTLSIIENISFPSLKGSDFAITQSTNSQDIYLFGFNITNPENGTSFILSNTGEILMEHNYTKLCPQNLIFGQYALLSPTMYGQDLLIANGTGIDVLNLSSGHQAYYAAPKYYCTGLLVPYGQNGKFIVSNKENNTTLIFNAISSSFCYGPTIPGEVLGGYFDPLNGYLYVSSESTAFCSCTGNITIITPSNGKVVMSILIREPQSNIEFSSINQTIFSLNFNGRESIFHSYAVTKAYNISFEESGLQANGTWFVNITGMNSSGALLSGSVYSVNLKQGNYTYTIGTSNKKFTATGGTIYANSSKTVYIKFSSVTYGVTFNETGLGTGISWSLRLNNSSYAINVMGSGSDISLNLPNGTYYYSVNPVSGYSITNKAGPVEVTGRPVTVYIAFTQLKYKFTFNEVGLPNGTMWKITLNGVEHNVTGNSFSIYLPNGTYYYSVGSINGYSLTNGTGNITMKGTSVSITIKFTQSTSSSITFYIEIGAILAVVVAVIGILIWRRTSK
ncbi:hypothetical protein [Caldiplasma sukawensis]